MNGPPETRQQWQKSTDKCMEDKTIHDIEPYSASNFTVPQYLMLRVLWEIKRPRQFDPKRFGLHDWIDKARRELVEYQSWKGYWTNFNGDLVEGTFALAQFNQRQVDRVPEHMEDEPDSLEFSPIAGRTRSHTGTRQTGIDQMTSRLKNIQITPTRQPRAPQTPVLGSPGSDQHESPSELVSNASEEIPGIYPRTKDEQIVNTAIIDFLNAFIVHRGLSVQWTLHRKLFVGKFTEGILTARTDGCLEQIGFDRAHALVEVKPLRRSYAPYTIAMQEAAQMVAWIKSEPDPEGFKGSRGHRLHVSQDRHQIFVIFAEYGENYVRYLNNTLGPDEDPGFMTMHQYGPWNTNDVNAVKRVGEILLAIALRADDACKGKKRER